VAGLSESALARLKSYAWPGNIRELQSVLRSAYAAAGRGELIQSAHLPAYVATSRTGTAEEGAAGVPDDALAAVRGRGQRDAVMRALERHPRVTDAARVLGVSTGYLYRLVKRLGIRTGARAPR
jgi:transcriptional regulator of acetoin/glycerol metabolism